MMQPSLAKFPSPQCLAAIRTAFFLRIACLLHRIIRLFRRHETRFNVFFVCLTDLTCTVHSFIFYGQVVTTEHKDPFREKVVFTLNQFPTFMYITLIKCVLHPLQIDQLFVGKNTFQSLLQQITNIYGCDLKNIFSQKLF